MKPVDEQLDRLMKSAAQAPRPEAGEASFALESRVLAHWRASLRSEVGEFYVLWFRRATIGAGLLAVASLAWNYHSFTPRSSAEMVADSAMSMGVEP
jgi:hypothetical protein